VARRQPLHQQRGNDLRLGRLNSSSDDLRANAAVERPSPTSPYEGRGQAVKAEELEVRPQVAPTVSSAEKPSPSTMGAHPFGSVASSMEAQAHTSCNRCAGYYMQETAPPLAPMPHLHDYGTSAATRDNPAHGPTVPIKHIDHGSVSRGRRHDG
jgi:hypothetical protein